MIFTQDHPNEHISHSFKAKLMYLETLKEILKKKDKKFLFPCIKDLVSNGLTLSRFSSKDIKPLRQDITQFIATWFKYIGISSDKCLAKLRLKPTRLKTGFLVELLDAGFLMLDTG